MRKGQKHTEESKRKMSKSRKGKFKGKNNPNYGKKASEETRRKQSEAHKGVIPSEVTRRKMSESQTGRKHSDKTKKKMREAWKNRSSFSDETRLKMSISAKNRPKISEETRKKMSEATKGKNNPNYGKPMSEEQKRKLSEALNGRIISEETRRKISETTKGRSKPKHSEAMKGINNPMYGKKHQEEVLQKMRGVKKGKNNPRWLGGISFEPYGSEFTKDLKQKIRERDDYICQYGGEYGKDIHHIDYDKKNNEDSNLITLCPICHAMTNKNRIYWKRLFRDIIRLRFGLKKRGYMYTVNYRSLAHCNEI
jgi:hypothetical protein